MQKRVVFEGSKRIVSLGYANTGKDTARYLVSLKHMRMKEDGSFEDITDKDTLGMFADKYIRFYPRSIVLGPNESQTMKVQLVNTGDLKPGEYRSHLYFRAVPNKEEKPVKPAEKPEGISVSLKPIFGITVPVIIRIGEYDATVKLENLSFSWQNDTTPVLAFTFVRSGNYSVYGEVTATWVSPSGREHEVGIVKGIAVYTPGTIRNSQLTLKRMRGVDYGKGKLVLRYKKPPEEKGSLLAEAMLELH